MAHQDTQDRRRLEKTLAAQERQARALERIANALEELLPEPPETP